MAVVLVALAAGCGGPDFRYLESSDGHMFAKVPSDWEIVRQGGVSLRYLAQGDPDLAAVRGDSTIPWRAEFRADDGTNLKGYVEGQHLDARLRAGTLLRDIIDVALVRAGVAEAERVKVRSGDLEGYRVTYSVPDGDVTVLHDEVWLIDDRKSGVYNVAISCDEACFEQHRGTIDEILTTFRVEQ